MVRVRVTSIRVRVRARVIIIRVRVTSIRVRVDQKDDTWFQRILKKLCLTSLSRNSKELPILWIWFWASGRRKICKRGIGFRSAAPISGCFAERCGANFAERCGAACFLLESRIVFLIFLR